MRLWRDAEATLVTGIALTLPLSVTQGWNWPLLDSPRAGIIALGVVGYGACLMSRLSATRSSMTGPFAFVANVGGMFLVGAGAIGIIANALPDLVVMMSTTFVLWLLATVGHLVAGTPRSSRAALA